MPKSILSHEELHREILKGCSKLAECAGSTLGPAGQNIIIQNPNKEPFITKDGATVCKNFNIKDPFQNMGAQIIRQASVSVEKLAGDNTTTTIILAEAILRHAQKYISSGANVFEIKKGIIKTVDLIISSLTEYSIPIQNKEQITQIATIASNGDISIGNLVAEAIDSIGKNGSIIVENGTSNNTLLSIIDGFRLPAGYISQSFVPEGQPFIKYEKPLILVTNHKISYVNDMLPVLKVVAREQRPFIIIADYIEGEALAALIMNTVRGTMKITAINAPFFGEERREVLKDLAISVGATYISTDNPNVSNLTDVKLEHLGSSENVTILKNQATFLNGKGNSADILNRINLLKEQIKQSEDLEYCEKIQERISRLSGGVAVIKVGGNIEAEVTERRFRIDDAIEAVKGAQEEGVSIGGGLALIKASKNVIPTLDNEDQGFGLKVVLLALYEPFNKIIFNAGKTPEVIMSYIQEKERNIIYDALNHKYVDAFEAGIIDSTKSLRCALQQATSAAIALITTNYGMFEGS